MFESLALPATMPVGRPLYTHLYTDRPATPDPVTVAIKEYQTKPQQIGVSSIVAAEPATASLAELAKGIENPSALENVQTNHSRVDKARHDRVLLLARKYERSLTLEAEARLEILTNRVRRLAPRITESNLRALSKTLDDIEDVSKGIDDLRALLNF